MWDDIENEHKLLKGLFFENLYVDLKVNKEPDEKKVKVHSVFLSLLHLCNEKNLDLKEELTSIVISKSK